VPASIAVARIVVDVNFILAAAGVRALGWVRSGLIDRLQSRGTLPRQSLPDEEKGVLLKEAAALVAVGSGTVNVADTAL
jgi:hypothetical protein